MPPDDPTNRASIDVRGLDDFLRNLDQFLDQIGSGTRDYSLIYGATGPIYHYTNLDGFKGIVHNHDLWLTHSRYSNDEEEMRLGYATARKQVTASRKQRAGSADWLLYLDNLRQLLKKPLSTGVYICCFCEEDDLLSQWRSYGANGTGVSIAFDAAQFNIVTGPDAPPAGLLRLWKVFYEPHERQRILQSAIDFAFDSPPLPAATIEERAQLAADFIEFFIPTFKNKGFAEEKELRLIFTPPKDFTVEPEFRVSRGMLVPYYHLNELIKRATGSSTVHLPITGVRVGPSPSKDLNMESVSLMLKSRGYPNIVPQKSATLYRG